MIYVTDLKPSTEYNISVTMINQDLEYNVMSNNGHLWSTQSSNHKPGIVKNVSFGEFVEHIPGRKSKLDVMMWWDPAEGKIIDN